MPRKPYTRNPDPTMRNIPFSWDLALNEKEKDRYEKIRAEKIQNGEERYDPETLRLRFMDGFIDPLTARKHIDPNAGHPGMELLATSPNHASGYGMNFFLDVAKNINSLP